MSQTDPDLEFPFGLKLYLAVVFVIFTLGYFALVIIENFSFIDAFYFLIVTVTTVGFGDITPKTPVSKLIVSILIIISISTLALLSEQVVSRIVAMNSRRDYSLPTNRLPYENHIVICGFTKIAENIALLFQARFFRLIVLDPHEVAVKRARNYDIEAYKAKPQEAASLSQVNIEEALALYLFMDDENANVLTSLQARNLASDDLLIYASTDHELSIEQGNLIGIDRTYHYERIVASNIRFSLSKIIAFALPNQLLSPDAKFFQVLVSRNFDYKKQLDCYYPVGIMDETLTEFTPIEDVPSIEAELEKDNLLMLTIPRAVAEDHIDDRVMNTPVVREDGDRVSTIIIGGYGDTAQHIVQEMGRDIIEEYDLKILCLSKNEADRARADGFSVISAERESLETVFEEEYSGSTLIVNLFDRLTDSLLVNTIVDTIGHDIIIIQLAHNRIETDVLIKSGANRILIPDVLMSRGMFLILLSSKHLINSMVWGNAHIFEHYLDAGSPLTGKTTAALAEAGYTALIYQTPTGEIISQPEGIKLENGGNVLVYRKHEILRASDQLVDQTHR